MTFSVRFFKRLILLVLALMIVIPTGLAIRFGLRTAELEKQVAGLGITTQKPNQVQSSPKPTGGDPDAVPTSYNTELIGEALSYQVLYPDLYSSAVVPAQREKAIDTVYLTFDCTPSSNTLEILNNLDAYGIKATFFVTGSTDPDAVSIMQEIVNRGHTIGLRSNSSSYQKLYQSVEDYLNDFKEIYDTVYNATGVRAEIFRFPGGSVNPYNSGIYQELIAEMLRRNFVFFDWSITALTVGASGSGDPTAEEISTHLINEMAGKDRAIVMFRDAAGKEAVAGAIPGIVEGLRSLGYSFQPLTATVLPVAFSYP